MKELCPLLTRSVRDLLTLITEEKTGEEEEEEEEGRDFVYI